MSSSRQDPPYSQFSFNSKHIKQYKKHSIITHVLLFLGTFASSMMAGAAWAGQSPLEITNWVYGFTYASLLMIFLSLKTYEIIPASKNGTPSTELSLLWFGSLSHI